VTPATNILALNLLPDDFDANGKVDLLWPNDASRRAVVWYMDGASGQGMQRFTYLTPFDVTGWTLVASADFNGGRRARSRVTARRDAPRRCLVYGRGGSQRDDGLQLAHADGRTGWRIVAASDLDGDGQPDPVWQHETTRRASVWFMAGVQSDRWDSWAWLFEASVPGWWIVGTSDMNDDGLIDAVWRTTTRARSHSGTSAGRRAPRSRAGRGGTRQRSQGGNSSA